MDANEDRKAKAKNFADIQYRAQRDQIIEDTQRKLAEAKGKMAARGLATSGPMDRETIRIRAEGVLAQMEARADALLEGCELHGVPVDESLANEIFKEVETMRIQMVGGLKSSLVSSMHGGVSSPAYIPRELERKTSPFSNVLKARIERRRLTPRSNVARPQNVYHVTGHNARINVNSTDNSTNIVETSTQQIFSSLRQNLSAQVPDGEDKQLILKRLDELEAAQNTPLFPARYTEFISVAANIMTIVAPFIPALTEMLKAALPS